MNKTSWRPALAGLLLAGAAGLAQAQAFPDKPITLVVPFPPGGTTDILARSLAEKMAADLKQPVIVENRQGAGGNVGADSVAKSRPDGYTMLLSSAGPLTINQHLYARLSYDPMRHFAPVSLLAQVPIMLVTHPAKPFKTVAEMIAYAKANPGKLSYGSQGNGTTSHLTMELLKHQAGLNIVHVPYRGSAPATTDMLGGTIDLMFDNSPSTLPHVTAQKLRALGVASAQRVAAMDSVPALSETVKGFESTAWFALVVATGTPDAVIQQLNRAVNTALAQNDMKEKFAASGVQLLGGKPEDLARHMRSESEKWAEVVRASGAKLE